MRALRRNSSRGFTLIELLVVIVILGILMAVAVPTFLSQQAKAQDSRTQQYLTTAFKAIRSSTVGKNSYPSSTSMVSWITASEPELTAKSGDCLTGVTSAPVDAVLVDPSSTPTSLQLCARSQSGNVWKLTASATGAQQLLDGTLVPLTVSGNEITDATRSADVQGDGLSNDSSTGIWEGTNNLATNGGFETSAAGWNTDGTSIGVSLSRDTTTSKFGAASGKLTVTAAGPGQSFYDTTAVGSFTAGDPYTFSIWVKGSGSAVGKNVHLQLATSGGVNPFAALGEGPNVALTSVWRRLTVSGTVDYSDRTQLAGYVILNSGVAGDTVNLDGAQIEKKAFATPYVETNGTAASRGGSHVQAPAAVINQTQGWVAVMVGVDRPLSNALGNNWPRLFAWGYLNEQAPRNSLDLYYNGPNGNWGFNAYNNAVSSSATAGGTNGYTYTGDGTEYVTVIGSWTSSQIGVSANGSPFVTAPRTGGAPAVSFDSSFDIGNLNDSQQWDGDILWFACGTGTLTSGDAATINSWGDTDPNRSSFPAAAQATMVWNGVGSTGSLK